MSADRLSVVREIYEAFARRDVAAVFARLHPDVEIHQTELLPWGGHYRGHEGARGFVAHVWTVCDGQISRFEAYIDTPAMREALGLR